MIYRCIQYWHTNNFHTSLNINMRVVKFSGASLTQVTFRRICWHAAMRRGESQVSRQVWSKAFTIDFLHNLSIFSLSSRDIHALHQQHVNTSLLALRPRDGHVNMLEVKHTIKREIGGVSTYPHLQPTGYASTCGVI